MIKINIKKAKNIAHQKRRLKREQKFKPYDDIISKQIPQKKLDIAEKKRKEIREKDAELQKQINRCRSINNLESLMYII